MEEAYPSFRSLLRAARYSSGMTLEGLAEASGVGCDTIVSIENGMLSLRQLQNAELARIADVLAESDDTSAVVLGISEKELLCQ